MSDHLCVHAAHHCPIDIPGLKHLFQSVENAGIFHSHSFLTHYLNEDERVDLKNELEFGTTSPALHLQPSMKTDDHWPMDPWSGVKED